MVNCTVTVNQFTESDRLGKIIAMEHLKPGVLELGDKSPGHPSVVRDTTCIFSSYVDIQHAVHRSSQTPILNKLHALLWGSFYSGQFRMATGRMIVQRPVLKQLVFAIKQRLHPSTPRCRRFRELRTLVALYGTHRR